MEEQIAKANAESNPYLRLAALHGLRPAKDLDGVGYPNSLVTIVGGRYALEVALVEAYRATKRTYLYEPPQRAVLHQGRPRDELGRERELYCAHAFRSGTSVTPAPPQWESSSYLGKGKPAVKHPIDNARVKEVETAHAQTYAKNDALFAAPAPSKSDPESFHTRSTVTSTKRTGTKLVVELAGV